MSASARGRRPKQRAIVTGGAGFIGSHLVDLLNERGPEVLVIDDLSSGHVANLAPGIRLEVMDIVSANLDRIFRAWRPDVVIHLAAQASVPRSIKDPLRDLEVNVIGTHRVAAAARDAGAGRFVFTSSGGAIYGDQTAPATEATLPAPNSYYGVHKLAAEGHVALAGPAYAIARPANVYGPRQEGGLEGAVVSAFLDQARSTGVLRIHGDGTQTRDFVHVQDVVTALWRIAQVDVPSGIWNIGSGQATSIADLASAIERAMKRPLGREFGPARPGDVTHSVLSTERLRGLGWQPTTNLTAGIEELVQLPKAVQTE